MARMVEATQQGDEYETWTADPPPAGKFYRFDVASGISGASGVLLIDGKRPLGVRGWTVNSHVDGVATVTVEFLAESINKATD